MRLDNKTPAKWALDKYLVETRKPQGRPRTTWWRMVLNDFKNSSGLDINFKSNRFFFKEIDRNKWKTFVKHKQRSISWWWWFMMNLKTGASKNILNKSGICIDWTWVFVIENWGNLVDKQRINMGQKYKCFFVTRKLKYCSFLCEDKNSQLENQVTDMRALEQITKYNETRLR